MPRKPANATYRQGWDVQFPIAAYIFRQVVNGALFVCDHEKFNNSDVEDLSRIHYRNRVKGNLNLVKELDKRFF